MAAATLTLISLALAAGGTAMNAVGQIKAGNKAKEAGEQSGQILEARARDARAIGADEESRYRASVRGLIGSQRAGFAAQGVDVGSGSAVDVQADAAYLGELDALTIRNNAAREAWGYEVEADQARKGGAIAQKESRWGAVTSIAGTAGSLAAQRYGFSGPGGRTSKATTGFNKASTGGS